MIYAVSKPLEEYTIIHGGFPMGLYHEYGYDKYLLALIMIATYFPYDYEIPIQTGKIRVTIKDIDPFRKTLTEEVDGVEVKTLLDTLNPVEFHTYIQDKDLTHLSIVKNIFEGNDNSLKLIVGARAGNWALNYRGKVSSSGKVVKVRFGRMNELAVAMPAELEKLNRTLKEELYNGDIPKI